MKKIVGFLVIVQLVLATAAFAAESDSDCTDGVQTARTPGDGNASDPAPVTEAPTAATR